MRISTKNNIDTSILLMCRIVHCNDGGFIPWDKLSRWNAINQDLKHVIELQKIKKIIHKSEADDLYRRSIPAYFTCTINASRVTIPL